MNVQQLIDQLSKIEDKDKQVMGIWMPQKEHHIFWLNTVEDDIDTVLLNIETE